MARRPTVLEPSRRTFLKTAGAGIAAAASISTFPMPALAQKPPVTIISNQNNPAVHKVFADIVAAYEAESGVQVVVNDIDTEANKTAIRSYLVAGAPDICFWDSGNRMRAFVKRGLFDDISDLIARENYKSVLGPTIDAVTVDGKQYGLPMNGTYWAVFYRKDVFADNGWTFPATFDDLLAFGDKAKAAGMIPIAMGTKELWPAGGWFDHMNLRVNGIDGHMALMNGEMSYLDPALTEVFDRWETLIKAGMFLPDGTSFDWQGAAALFAQKKAAMMDLGSFISAAFSAADVPQLTFANFPEIKAGVPRCEDFSVDSIHIPTNGKNKEGARDFLAYFYRPENLAQFLKPTGAVPPRNDLPPSPDPLVNLAVEQLKTTAGTAQYYDRDTDPDMAEAGLKGFQEFTAHPERRMQILTELEATRKRIFKT